MLVSPAFCLVIESHRHLRSCRGWKALLLLFYFSYGSQTRWPIDRNKGRTGPTLALGFVGYADHRGSTAAVGPIAEKV